MSMEGDLPMIAEEGAGIVKLDGDGVSIAYGGWINVFHSY